MSLSQQRRIVAVSSMLVFTLGFLNIVVKGKSLSDSARFFIGIGFAYTIVSIFTDMGSEIGAGFALLIMIAAIFKEGDFVLKWLATRSLPTAPTKKLNKNVKQAAAKQPGSFKQNVFPNFSGPQFQPGGSNG